LGDEESDVDKDLEHAFLNQEELDIEEISIQSNLTESEIEEEEEENSDEEEEKERAVDDLQPDEDEEARKQASSLGIIEEK